jgi:hypothetical protein
VTPLVIEQQPLFNRNGFWQFFCLGRDEGVPVRRGSSFTAWVESFGARLIADQIRL